MSAPSPSDPSYSARYPSFLAGLTAPAIPHASLFIDLSVRDALYALWCCLRPWDRATLESDLSRLWLSLCPPPPPLPSSSSSPHAPAQVLVTLSARTALNLYLSARNFPKGSLVLLSAITIPDVLTVIRAHGLVPVPVDVDASTLAMRAEGLENALQKYGVLVRGSAPRPAASPASTASGVSGAAAGRAGGARDGDAGEGEAPRVAFVMVAHLFGRVVDPSPLVNICNIYSCPFVEDCAEALAAPAVSGDGMGQHREGAHPWCFGHPESEIVLHSFGTTKV